MRIVNNVGRLEIMFVIIGGGWGEMGVMWVVGGKWGLGMEV